MIVEIGGNDNGMGIRFNSDDLIAGIASNSSRTTITLSNFASNANWLCNQWNHVAFVYNVNSLTLYLNGVQVAQNTNLSFSSVGNSSNQSRLGAPSSSSQNNASVFNDQSYSTFLGNMDNMYIIKGALTAADLVTLKNTNICEFGAGNNTCCTCSSRAPTGLDR